MPDTVSKGSCNRGLGLSFFPSFYFCISYLSRNEESREDALQDKSQCIQQIKSGQKWTALSCLIPRVPQLHGTVFFQALVAIERSRCKEAKHIHKTESGTSLVVQRLRLRTPNAGGPGSIPGQGTRSHMLQLKIPHTTRKILRATTKTRRIQINKFFF